MLHRKIPFNPHAKIIYVLYLTGGSRPAGVLKCPTARNPRGSPSIGKGLGRNF